MDSVSNEIENNMKSDPIIKEEKTESRDGENVTLSWEEWNTMRTEMRLVQCQSILTIHICRKWG